MHPDRLGFQPLLEAGYALIHGLKRDEQRCMIDVRHGQACCALLAIAFCAS
jgi:hypothetical protein